MNKILVVSVNWVGDVIFSSPIFKALRKNFPESHIACLAVPRVREILESIPQIDQIIIYDEQGHNRSLSGKLKLVQTLRQQRFGVAFLLHRSLTRALLVFLAGIPQRVGYATKGRGFLLTHRARPLSPKWHRCDYYLQVIESFGIKVEERACELIVGDEALRYIDGLLRKEGIKNGDFLIVLNLGGNWELKRWPVERFALLADRLNDEFKARVIIPGAETDLGLANTVVKRTHFKPIILTGQTSLKQLMALMSRAHLVISADSGPLHLASAVGTKTIGLFGPTRPEVTGPRGTGTFVLRQRDVGCNQEPCYNLSCPDNICMRSISVEEVVNEVRRLKG